MMYDSFIIQKSWGLIHSGPNGRFVMRNPPPAAFKPMGKLDIPAFAHDGAGNVYEGEWAKDDGGIYYYHTRERDHPNGPRFFKHGIDAAAYRLLRALQGYVPSISSPDVVKIFNEAIDLFNQKHPNEKHHLAPFESLQWRKLRSAPLPKQVEMHPDKTTRPTRSQDGTKITLLTNNNAAENPNGKFIESYHLPFNVELRQLLEQHLSPNVIDMLAHNCRFLLHDKPFVYANYTTPPKYIRSEQRDPGSAYIDGSKVPFPDEFRPAEQQEAFTWQVLHHLPDVFFKPMPQNREAIDLQRRTADHIRQAMSGGNVDAIPNFPVTFTFEGQRIQRPLQEALLTPEYQQAVIKEISSVPAMMFLFGRANQKGGNFMKLFNEVMGRLEDYSGLSHDEHTEYYTAGGSGKGTGMHAKAGRVMALANMFGSNEDGSSKMRDVQFEGITPDEQEQVNLNRRLIEGLAEHQMAARGHERKDVGEVPSKPLGRPMHIQNYHGDMLEPQLTLDPHMENYDYQMVEDFADYNPGDLPQEVPASAPEPPSAHPAASGPPPTSGPSPPPLADAGTPGMTPALPEFQAIRPDIGRLDPHQFRQFMAQAGIGRQRPSMEPELSPVEARAQQGLADPRQTLLTQFMRSEDAHLPVMDQVMKALERMQYREAELDDNVVKHLSPSRVSSRQLASYVGLTSEEVTTINHTMGDWHNIAKSYKVKPEVVKVIKMSMR